jgi:hypothetical protein
MKSKLLKFLNPVLFIVFLIQFVSISLMKMEEFGLLSSPLWVFDVHNINGAVFSGLVILHIILNWGWIKSTILGIKPKGK